ncbi:MAG: SEC-C metal-binding domain-containing protein [Thermodesulfobacteriota bacterium]
MEGRNREKTKDTSYFSDICIERCAALCCDPWWGIISYTVVKEGGLGNMSAFRPELVRSIRARSRRIVEGYVTSGDPPEPLFCAPERYNVALTDIRVNSSSIALNLLAMFAFRCNFLSEEKVCMIHPSVIGRGAQGAGGAGDDIRPPHCGYMGSLNVAPNEKGYCRIIHAAQGAGAGERAAVDEAIRVEKAASLTHYGRGVESAEQAADSVIAQLREMCAVRAPHLLPQQRKAEKRPGRNDPCWCGSGKKFKKCHG